MKEAIIRKGTIADIIDSPIPKPGAHQVVIKVAVSGSNPKDWKYPDWLEDGKGEINQGDDIAGTVHAVGSNVTEFAVGDRVGAFHEMHSPNGSYAEYALAWDYCTFRVPESVSFEEVATFPLAAMTAAVGLYHHRTLGLPAPWQNAQTEKSKTALVVYGGASAVGAFVIQLARRGGIHPIIAVAGKGQDYAWSLLDKSKGDAVVDYRNGDDAVVTGIQEAAKAAGVDKIMYAYDAVSSKETQTNLQKVLADGGRLTTVLPGQELEGPKEKTVHSSLTYVGAVHGQQGYEEADRDFGFVYFRWLARGIEQGWLKAHNPKVVPGGLNGVAGALQDLKNGKASAVKYVFRIPETPGAGSGQ